LWSRRYTRVSSTEFVVPPAFPLECVEAALRLAPMLRRGFKAVVAELDPKRARRMFPEDGWYVDGERSDVPRMPIREIYFVKRDGKRVFLVGAARRPRT